MASPTTSRLRPIRWIGEGLISVLAALWLLFDDAVALFLRPIFSLLARIPVVARVERWTTTLRPYPALVMCVAPLALIEPAKVIAVLLMGRGHFLVGCALFLGAFALGLAVVDRMFAINREKLLTIAWFARLFHIVTRLRDLLYARLRDTAAWRGLRALARRWRPRWLRLIGRRVDAEGPSLRVGP